jgi:hypothetical protein
MGGAKAVMVMAVIAVMVVMVVVASAVILAMIMAVIMVMLMDMAMKRVVDMAVDMALAVIMIQRLSLDAGLALAAAAKGTHLFNLQFFDSQFFAAGDTDAIAATFGAGVEPLPHRHGFAALQTQALPRRLHDLQPRPIRQAATDHGVETEAQGLRLHPRQGADLKPDPHDAPEGLTAGLLLQHLEDALANRHFVHGGRLPAGKGWLVGLSDRGCPLPGPGCKLGLEL